MTTRPCDGDEDPVHRAHLARLLPQLLARARFLERSRELGIERARRPRSSARRWRARPDRAGGVRQLRRSPPRACPPPRRASPAPSSRSSSAASDQSETSFAASSPSAVSGVPALSMPSTIVSVACTARSRPVRTNPVRPCGVSDCGSSLPAAGKALGVRISSTMSSISPRQTPTAPHDALRPLARPTLSRRCRRACRSRRSTTITTTIPATIATIQASAPRIAATSPGVENSSTTRDEQPPEALHGRDADTFVGGMRPLDLRADREHVQGPLTLVPITAVSRPACTAVTTGGSPKSRS